MKSSISRIHRTNFDEDVNKAYDADKEFVISYTDAHIVELVLTFLVWMTFIRDRQKIRCLLSTQMKKENPGFIKPLVNLCFFSWPHFVYFNLKAHFSSFKKL